MRVAPLLQFSPERSEGTAQVAEVSLAPMYLISVFWSTFVSTNEHNKQEPAVVQISLEQHSDLEEEFALK